MDVFQLDTNHELYAHMNVNYLRLAELPDFDHYGRLLDALAKGDGFISTGEIVLPRATIAPGRGDSIHVETEIDYTFPLRLGEIVWGNGKETHRQIDRPAVYPRIWAQRFCVGRGCAWLDLGAGGCVGRGRRWSFYKSDMA